jgi:hypothetical protein
MYIGVVAAPPLVDSLPLQAAIERRNTFLRRLADGEVDAVELWRVLRRAGLPIESFDLPAGHSLLAAAGDLLPASIWL